MNKFEFLVGEWSGKGQGHYPTINPFAYNEVVTFAAPNPAKPILVYTQKTKHAEKGVPMHSEMGYLRFHPESDKVSLALTHVTGITEMQEGEAVTTDGKTVITLTSTNIGRGSMCKDPAVTNVRRVIEISGDTLHYYIDMATTTTKEITRHLEATLQKAPTSS
eukprot:GFYU01003838.1.p1 GENE.GFYU01003838.1~~GFYU01003838.1.p1  ORF type:complete len:177 (-),score=35.18 GFYU01003838.1:64-552(-)